MNYIAVCGIIGSGKTYISNVIGTVMGIQVYYEPQIQNDDSILSDFYSDMKQYGFLFQMYLLSERSKIIKQAIESGKNAVFDRSIFEDLIFTKMLVDTGKMESREYKIHKDLMDIVMANIQYPKLMIYLRVSPEIALNRIKLRGRECEMGITLDYLTKLNDAYEIFFNDLETDDRFDIMTIDFNENIESDDDINFNELFGNIRDGL